MVSTTRLVDATAAWLERRFTRRSFLGRVAVTGSALAVSGVDFVLRPGTAYASVCGSGSTCAAGWTAMCCTINNGLNRCPPGSFAGGWWKADGASLCGGGARYYIDCQAECTSCGCSSGHAFCAEQCWDCKPHCASGTCDERRVCTNVFRYGQCHTEIACTGPVLCRAISCTPPWHWESCSTASATDDRTVDHNAPCLPQAWSPIQRRYAELGSEGSVLGASIGAEYAVRHGRAQHYQYGTIYASAVLAPHYLVGRVIGLYVSLGETASVLGLPVTDSVTTPDGRGQMAAFQHGRICYTPDTGTHAVWTDIYTHWVALRAQNGQLGYPTTTEAHCADGIGEFADFQHGTVYAGPFTGVHAVTGTAFTRYAALGRERGPLGYPTADTAPSTAGGQATGFRHGGIYAVTATATAYAVFGPIFTAWQAAGGTGSRLGYPLSNVLDVAGGQYCAFQHGTARYDAATGQVTFTYT